VDVTDEGDEGWRGIYSTQMQCSGYQRKDRGSIEHLEQIKDWKTRNTPHDLEDRAASSKTSLTFRVWEGTQFLRAASNFSAI
jgi:hypothetical protein